MTTPDTEPATDRAPEPTPDPAPAVFRTPLAALVAVVFLALSLSPIAFQGGWWFALFTVPLAIVVWLVRTRTTVDTDGLRVRTLWGSSRWSWSRVSTLRLVERDWVRAVDADGGELVLRGVRVRDLGRIGEASGGRIRVPSPAEAEAAEEHRRELEAARMRIARLREQYPELTREEAEEADAAETTTNAEDTTAHEPAAEDTRGERDAPA